LGYNTNNNLVTIMATEIVNILCQKSGDGRLPIFMLDHDQQNVFLGGQPLTVGTCTRPLNLPHWFFLTVVGNTLTVK
jgi:hypothetical protein